METFKPLTSRNKEELIALHGELNLQLPDDPKPTNADLITNLKNKGVTNQKLKALNKKRESENSPKSLVNSQVVVAMDRSNASFTFGKHTFSRLRKYVPMPETEANELISRYDGFRKASREEVENYYK